MSAIDERIVKMQFDNQNFERNVGTSLNTIDKLKKSLDFSSATKGLNELEDSVKHFSLDDIGRSLESLADKFNWENIFKMGLLGEVASRIVSTVEAAISRIKGALHLENLDGITNMLAGWQKYADKTTSVATIMAATGKSMEYVSEQMDRLNYFTDETSYNFTDMTSNIGKFTANGIELEKATSAMEGIATWAARSGQNASTASRVMYNLSQAIGMGSLKLQDWKSVELANMGTQEFKETALKTAAALGKLKKEADGTFSYLDKTGKQPKTIKINVENFRETLSSGWFDNDVILGVLNEYGKAAELISDIHDATGLYASDMTELVDLQKEHKLTTEAVSKALKSAGDSEWDNAKHVEAVQKQIQELASDEYAFSLETYKAAQEARTFGDAMDAVADAVSTSWMNVFELLFGGYEQAKELWTDLANNLIEVFQALPNSIVDLLQEVKLSGADAFIKELEAAGLSLDEIKGSIIGIVGKDGLREIIGDAENFEQALREGRISAELMNQVLDGTKNTIEKVTTSTGVSEEKFKQLSKLAVRVRAGEFVSDKGTAGQIKMIAKEAGITEEEAAWVVKLATEQHKVHRELTMEEVKQLKMWKELASESRQTIETQENLTDEEREKLKQLYEELDRESAQEAFGEGFINVGHIFLETVNQIREALGELFPKPTAHQLVEFATKFRDTTGAIRDFLENSTTLKNVIVALALPFRVIADVISGAFMLLKPLASLFMTLIAPFVGLASKIGESVLAVKEVTGELDPFASMIHKVAEAGAVLIDFITKVVQYVGEIVKNRLVEKFSGSVSSLGEAFQKFKENKLKGLEKFIESIKNADVEAVGNKVIGVLLKIWHLTEPLRKAVKFVGKTIFDFVKRLSTLKKISGLTNLQRVMLALQDTARKTFRIILNKLREMGVDVDGKIIPALNKVKAFLDPIIKALKTIKDYAKQAIDYFKDRFKTLGDDGSLNIFQRLWQSLKDTATWALDKIKAKLAELGIDVDDIRAKIINAYNSIKEFLAPVWEKIQKIGGYIKRVLEIFKNYWEEFGKDDSLNIFQRAWESLKATAVDVWNKIKEKLKEYGLDIDGIQAKITELKDKIASIFKGTGEDGESVFSKILTAIKDAFDLSQIKNFGDLVEKIFSGLGTVVGKAFSGIKQGLKNLGLGNVLKMFLGFKLGNRILAKIFKDKNKSGIAALLDSVKEITDTIGEKGLKGLIFGGDDKGGGIIGTFKQLATSLLMVGGALFLIAAALALLSIIKPENLAKSFGFLIATLASVGAILVGLAHYMKELGIKPAELIAIAAAILIVSVALVALAGALALFSLVAKMKSVWKGLLVMAISLGIVVGALFLLGKTVNGLNLIGIAAAILIMSVALVVLAGALAAFTAVTNMDGTAKALIVMAVSLLLVVGALYALSAAGPIVLVGAAALLIASVAFIGFAVAIGILLAALLLAEPALTSLGNGILGLTTGVCESIALVISTISNGIVEIVSALSEALVIATGGILEAGQNILALVEETFNTISDGISTIGTGLGEGIAGIGKGIGDAIAAIGEGIGTAGAGIGTALAEVGTGAGTALEQGLGGLGAGIAGLGAGIGEALTSLAPGIAEYGAGIGTAIAEVGAGAATALELGLGALGSGISALGTGISEAFASIGSGIATAGVGIGTAITEIGTAAGEALAAGLGGFGEGISALGTGIDEALTAIGSGITTAGAGIGSAITEIGSAAGTALELGLGGLGAGISGLGEGISEALIAIGSGITIAGAGIGTAITEIGTAAGEALTAGLGGLGTGISDLGAGIGEALTGIGSGITEFGAGIGGAITEVGSAAGTALEAGLGGLGAGIAGLGAGINEALTNIGTGIQNLDTGIGAGFAIIGEAAGTAMHSALDGLAGGIETVGASISTAIEGIGSAIATHNESIAASIETLGSSIGTGFENVGSGISTAIETVQGSISEFGTSLSATITEVSESLSGGIDSISASVSGIAESISSVGGGLSIVGTGLIDISTGLKAISTIDLLVMANGMNSIRSELVGWNRQKEKLTAAVPIITSISDSVAQFATIDTQVTHVATLVGGLGDIFSFLEKNTKKGNLQNVNELTTSVTTALSTALTAIQNYIPQFQTAGNDLGTTFVQAFESHAMDAWGAAGNMAFQAYQGANLYTQYFNDIGYNMGIGISNGLAESSYMVVAMAEQVATAARDTIKNILKIHSPSQVFAQLGNFIALGLANGIQNGGDSVTLAAEHLAQNTIDAIQMASSNISSIMSGESFMPTITPVIDLSNAQAASNSLAGTLAPLNLSGGRYQVDGELIERGTSTRSIVNEIQSLNDKLALLGEHLDNMQIVLDSGVLVGATSAQMDAQFGIMNMRAGRGN